jgi:hypothetical protein
MNNDMPPQRRITPAKATRAAFELARQRRQLHHRPTGPQLRALARLGGSRPCSYRLDRSVNWLPESLPLDFPHGASGLCFAHRGGEVVVLPDGGGFALIKSRLRRGVASYGAAPRRPSHCFLRDGGSSMTTMRLAEPTVVRAAELDADLLRAAGLELERVVMLEPTPNGLTVRKLTADEKIDHSERTGEAAFLGSDEEQEEFFAALDRRADA